MTVRPATSRWRSSATSFGPVGRIALTILAVLPVWWLLGANVRLLAQRYEIGYFIGACAWTVCVIPLLMRDIWKKVADRDAAPILTLPEELGPPKPGESILERRPPSRW